MISRISAPERSSDSQVAVLIGTLLPLGGAPAVDISCRRRLFEDPRHPHQVVGGADDQREQLRSLSTFEPRTAKSAHRLGPAKDLLDALAKPLTDRVSGMPGRSAVDVRAALMRVVLGDVRGDAVTATLPDESTGVVGLVSAECTRPDA